jgi:hypothetical protein
MSFFSWSLGSECIIKISGGANRKNIGLYVEFLEVQGVQPVCVLTCLLNLAHISPIATVPH